jgi:hypothetical protein
MRTSDLVTIDSAKAPFVVLHHSGVEPVHFDLLIDLDPAGSVPTWRLGNWPADLTTTAKLLKPHRRFYLTYEGPVTGDRGQVTQVAAGTLAIDADADCAIATFGDGSRVRLPLRDNVSESD